MSKPLSLALRIGSTGNLPREGQSNKVKNMVQTAPGYTFRADPAVLVVGPTGLAYDASKDILYVASTGDNSGFVILDAGSTTTDQGMGKLIYADSAQLRGPLGLVLDPNGDLLTANGDAVDPDRTQPREISEAAPNGRFVGQLSLEPAQGVALGVALTVAKRWLNASTSTDDMNRLDARFVNH